MIGKTLFVSLAIAAQTLTGQLELIRLDAREIRAALTRNMIDYSPPGWADAGAHGEFLPGGQWRGVRLMRGPSGFSGQWEVRKDRLCVRPEQGLWEKYKVPQWYCRTLWRDAAIGELRMDHVSGGFGPRSNLKLQTLSVRPLPQR